MNSRWRILQATPPRMRPRGCVTPSHAHDWHQLTLCISGSILVDCDDVRTLLAPGDAVWIPPGHAHGASSDIPSQCQSISIAACVPDALSAAPLASLSHVRHFRPRPLLLELIARLTQPEPQPASVRMLIDALIILECAHTPNTRTTGPHPRHRILRHLCESILQNPRIDIALPSLARAAGSSPSTINRLFLREMGITFRDWRQQVIYQRAVAMRHAGKPMDVIAHTLGYANRNALSAMMARQTPCT